MKTAILIAMTMVAAAMAACAIEFDATDANTESPETSTTEQGLCVPAGCDEYGCWGQQGDCGSSGGGSGDPTGGGGGGDNGCQPNPGSGCSSVSQWSTAKCTPGIGANLYCVGICGGSLSHCIPWTNDMGGLCIFAMAAGENGCR